MGDKGIKPVLRNTLPKVKYIPPQWDQTVGTAPLSPDNDPLLSLWSQSTSKTDDHSEVPGGKKPSSEKRLSEQTFTAPLFRIHEAGSRFKIAHQSSTFWS